MLINMKITVITLFACFGVVLSKEYYRPEGGRPVFPLVPIGSGPVDNGMAPGLLPGTDDHPPPPRPSGPEPAGPVPTRHDYAVVTEPVAFVETKTGHRVGCITNADCYGFREPDDWCPLPAGGVYRYSRCKEWSENFFEI